MGRILASMVSASAAFALRNVGMSASYEKRSGYTLSMMTEKQEQESDYQYENDKKRDEQARGDIER